MGKMIQKISTAIRGKNTPHFNNSNVNVKNGDLCIIVNAADPLFNGKKLLYKNLRYHTGFVGHLRTHSYKSILNKKPELLVINYFYSVLLSIEKGDAEK
jgi:large subunit ribosomal protein L13